MRCVLSSVLKYTLLVCVSFALAFNLSIWMLTHNASPILLTVPTNPTIHEEPAIHQELTFEDILISSGSEKIIHKFSRYYERLFAPLRHDAVRLLEIGVQQGKSMKLWQTYFSRAEHVYGIGYMNFQEARYQSCDMDNATKVVASAPCTIYKGDQSNTTFLNWFVEDTGGDFDIIIDDASHVPNYEIISFETLWPAVKPDGLYIVEDLETNWWSPNARIYGYRLQNQTNAVERWKGVVDAVNRKFNHGRSKLTDQKPGVYSDIVHVGFGQNIVIFRKAAQNEEKLLAQKYDKEEKVKKV